MQLGMRMVPVIFYIYAIDEILSTPSLLIYKWLILFFYNVYIDLKGNFCLNCFTSILSTPQIIETFEISNRTVRRTDIEIVRHTVFKKESASPFNKALQYSVLLKKGGILMATFFMFGKYTSEAVKKIGIERTQQAINEIKKLGGEVNAMHVLLGEYDLLFCINLPGVNEAIKASVTLTQLTGISFTTCPAITVEAFDQVITEKKPAPKRQRKKN